MFITAQKKIREAAMISTAVSFCLILMRGTADFFTGAALGVSAGFISLLLLSGAVEHLMPDGGGIGMFVISTAGKAFLCAGVFLAFCVSGVSAWECLAGFTAAYALALARALRGMKEVPVD